MLYIISVRCAEIGVTEISEYFGICRVALSFTTVICAAVIVKDITYNITRGTDCSDHLLCVHRIANTVLEVKLHTHSSRCKDKDRSHYYYNPEQTKPYRPNNICLSLSLHFNSHFPGGPGLTSTKMSPFWILLKLRVMEVMVTSGAIRRAKLQ